MKSRHIPKRKTEDTSIRMPFLGKILPYWQLLIFLILCVLFLLNKGSNQWLMIIATAGLIPSAILFLTHRTYLKEEKEGRKLMHRSVSYLVAFITVFFYSLALARSQQLIFIARIFMIPGAFLVYYSLFVNLQGRGRADLKNRNKRR